MIVDSTITHCRIGMNRFWKRGAAFGQGRSPV